MKKNILIYPSGAENALEIYSAIKNSIHINVIPATGKRDHSELIYENEVEGLPYVQSDNFLNELNVLIKKKDIDFIFPTHDTVALFLSENSTIIDCEVITASHKTNHVCRYKSETYELFKDLDFCPSVYKSLCASNEYPIFSKPDVGEGSKGVALVNSLEEHSRLLKSTSALLFLEYLPGKEYTIDCFTNRHGKLQFVGPRERVEVQMGISFRSKAVARKDRLPFTEIATQINNRLQFRGLWFFQLKEGANGKLKLLEISTRASGTMGFFRHKGVNLSLLSLFDFFDWDVEICENEYDLELFRATKNRFKYDFEFKRVYLDFDDTLIVNNKVNITVLSFVYQCKNLNIEVYLLTKHSDDIMETLSQFSIEKNLFQEIITLGAEDRKSNYINTDQAIFIDNWYVERKEVSKLDIPVFDVDAVASLLKN